MRLDVGILLVGERHVGGIGHLLLVLLEDGLVNLDLRGSESWCSNELLLNGLVMINVFVARCKNTYELSVADELSGEPEERLLEVVV